jgi:hypothetical protein
MSQIPNTPPSGAPSEPLVKVGGVIAFLTALFARAGSFGLHISNDQQSALLGFAAVAAPLIVMAWGRVKVFSPKTVRQMVRQAALERARDLPTTGSADVRDSYDNPGGL